MKRITHGSNLTPAQKDLLDDALYLGYTLTRAEFIKKYSGEYSVFDISRVYSELRKNFDW